jgi:AcrR family transcriptional regulator
MIVDVILDDMAAGLQAALRSGGSPREQLRRCVEAHARLFLHNRIFTEEREMSDRGRQAFRALTLRQHEHDGAALERLSGSRGRPAVGFVCAVLDENGRELPDGQIGEICARARGHVRLLEAAGAHGAGAGRWLAPDVAESAGIARPTLYKYVDSKRQLLDMIVDAVQGDMAAALDAALRSNGTPRERLRLYVEAHAKAFHANRVFYGIVFAEEKALSDRGRRAFRVGPVRGRTTSRNSSSST